MKNVRVKVTKNCIGESWCFGIYESKKLLMKNTFHRSNSYTETYWFKLSAAIRNAKAMAKRIGIKYDPKIIKQHGC